jgi:glucuronide carrier protein
VAWACVSYAAFQLAYSFVNIPYGSLSAAMNRPLIVLCLSSLLYLTGMFSIQTVAVYYARDMLGNVNLYIVMTVVQTVGMVAAAAIVPKAVETVGKKRTYLAASVIGAAAGGGVAIARARSPRSGSPAGASSASGSG